MTDSQTRDTDDPFEQVRVSVMYSETLNSEIERQVEQFDIADSRSEWFRHAALYHENVMEFSHLAEAAEQTPIPTFMVSMPVTEGSEPESPSTRTTISVYKHTEDTAKAAVEAGVVDSVNQWFVNAAYTFLGIQQMANAAGAQVVDPIGVEFDQQQFE
jgi:hypothetical protein